MGVVGIALACVERGGLPLLERGVGDWGSARQAVVARFAGSRADGAYGAYGNRPMLP